MNQLKKLHDKYTAITDSYCGDKTDWKEKHRQLEKLLREAQKNKIPQSKNSRFYNDLKLLLVAEINREESRIFKNVLKGSV